MKPFILLCGLFIFCLSCNPKLAELGDDFELDESLLLDTLVVMPETNGANDLKIEDIYRHSKERRLDLTHTSLDLKLDWQKQQVIGKAILTLEPYFYSIDTLVIDAKKMDIKSIAINSKTINNYSYDSTQLTIPLNQSFNKGEKFDLIIDYVANPNSPVLEGPNASDADKGLFFINPDNTLNKPKQIWTQGQTENNSRWFPTLDSPNERCSQEVFITIDKEYKTLSNGLLIKSVMNNDGTRTDQWLQKDPHAPYLFMIAVGEFAIVEDVWKDLPLYYYVEPQFEPFAKEIFNHTPEMLSFFSQIFQLDFPWDKYAQIVVRDFVAGAMENTGAVIYGDFVQRDPRSLIDESNDHIVAHELVHHWFGNLVTCESWSNLTLNEGFANYGEYLWQEHKYGASYADEHRQNELSSYLFETQVYSTHPLIHFSYNDKEDMFDAHSYNKGGLVLHMLRNFVGNEAFFSALNHYLTKNAYTSVEAHDLRLSFEKTTGKDLNWFFNQWYFGTGHPTLYVSYDYSQSKRTTIHLEQVQKLPESENLFILPFNVKIIFEDGSSSMHKITMDKRTQSFNIDHDDKNVVAALVDGTASTLAFFVEPRSKEESLAILMYDDHFIHRKSALNNLTEIDSTLFNGLINDNHHYFRIQSIERFGAMLSDERLTETILNDDHPKVQIAALNSLYERDSLKGYKMASQLVLEEVSYSLLNACMDIYYDCNKTKALKLLEDKTIPINQSTLNLYGSLFANSGDVKYLSFFEEQVVTAIENRNYTFLEDHIYLIKESSPNALVSSIQYFFDAFSLAKSENVRISCKNVCHVLIQEFDELVPFHEDLRPKLEHIRQINEALGK